MFRHEPLVSVICLCYNHAEYVYESLESVAEQSYENIQLIICDDASDDDSVKVIEQWLQTKNTRLLQSIEFIKNDTNIGNTATFNNALKHCNGDYIIDLAGDDFLLPYCIEKLMIGLSNSTYDNLGVVFSNVKIIDANGAFISNYYPRITKHNTLETPPSGRIFLDLLSDNVVPPTTMLIKKDVYDFLSGYDSHLAYEDLDFWLRSSKYFSYDYVDEVLMVKRELPDTLSTKFFQKNEHGKKLRASTYTVLKRTQASLEEKSELKAILKRIHYEIATNYKAGIYGNTLRYIKLKLKNHLKQMSIKD